MIGKILPAYYSDGELEAICDLLPQPGGDDPAFREDAATRIMNAILELEISVHFPPTMVEEMVDDWQKRVSSIAETRRILTQNRGFFSDIDPDSLAATLHTLKMMEESVRLGLGAWRQSEKDRPKGNNQPHERRLIRSVAEIWCDAASIDLQSMKISAAKNSPALDFMDRAVRPALEAIKSRKCADLGRHISAAVYSFRREVANQN
jgi:hypothetical protein